MKKSVVLGVICASLLSTSTFAEFKDVKPDAWYFSSVEYVVQNNIFSGVSANEFLPSENMTRAMIVQTIYNMEGKPSFNEVEFLDVEPEKWYNAAVSWATTNNIASGIGDNKFAPNELITREQIVSMLYNYAKYKRYDVSVGEDTNILSYNDVDKIHEYAFNSIQWACGSGIILGDNGYLRPDEPLTRAEAACIIRNFDEYYLKCKAVIKLDGNITTGYVWSAKKYDEDIISVSEYRYIPKENDEMLLGSPGVFEFVITSLKPGKTEIVFEYARPWEENNISNIIICELEVDEARRISISQKAKEKLNTVTVITPSKIEGFEGYSVRILKDINDFSKYLSDFSIGSETLVAMGDIATKYNEEYFNNNRLIIITKQEIGKGIRNEVSNITRVTDEILAININRVESQTTTFDEALWHIFMDLPNEMYKDILEVKIMN